MDWKVRDDMSDMTEEEKQRKRNVGDEEGPQPTPAEDRDPSPPDASPEADERAPVEATPKPTP